MGLWAFCKTRKKKRPKINREHKAQYAQCATERKLGPILSPTISKHHSVKSTDHLPTKNTFADRVDQPTILLIVVLGTKKILQANNITNGVLCPAK